MHLKLAAAAIVGALVIVPGLAEARAHHHRAHHYHLHYGLPYEISYNNNYGPGPFPGTFAFYDGPSTNACAQGAATYRGHDRRRHPCF